MTIRQQWIMVGAIVVALGAALGLGSHFMKDELFPVSVGSQAPNFRAKVLGENRYKTFDDYRGHVVLLNVWGTYCPPCIVEMPSLQKLYETYRDSGLKLVAVSIDDAVSEDSIARSRRTSGLRSRFCTTPRTRSSERIRLQVIRRRS